MYDILVADDEEIIREGFKYLLDWDQTDFKLSRYAADGEEALDCITKYSPDIAIIDINMPKMSGLELLERVRSFNSHIKFIILSGYNDFEYAQQAIKAGVSGYLLKPVDEIELLNILDSIKEDIERQNEVNNYYLKNRITALLDNTPGSDSNAAPLFNNSCCYISVIADTSANVFDFSHSGSSSATPIIQNCISKTGVPDNECIILDSSISELHAVLFFGNSCRFVNPRSFADTLLHELAQQKAAVCSILIGKALDSAADLSESKKSIDILRLKKFYNDSESIFDYNSAVPSAGNKNLRDMNIIDLIFFSAKQANIELTTQYINAFCDMLADEEILLSSVSLYINTIVMSSIKLIRSGDAATRYMSLFVEFNKAKNITLSKTRAFLLAFFRDIINTISSERKKGSSTLFSSILEYIHKNYDTSINLQSIADNFYMNSAYLGRLFKSKTGKSFNTYLNHLRISNAKRLLETTDLTISAIAEAVGYKDFKYFVTVFEKFEHITPSNYRRQSENYPSGS